MNRKYRGCLSYWIGVGVVNWFAVVLGGLILTENNAILIGEVQQEGDRLIIVIQEGNKKIKDSYKIANVKWYTLDPQVDCIYKGAKLAFDEKKYEIAKILVEESIKKESRYRAPAQQLLAYVQAALKKELLPGAPVAPSDEALKATESALGSIAPAIGKQGSSSRSTLSGVAKQLENQLIVLQGEDRVRNVVPYPAEELKGAQYFALVFAPIYDKDVRDFCRKVDLQYRLLCNDLKGRFAVILIPHDTTEEEFKQALSIINVSFPILLREFVENHPFMRYKQQVVEIVIIDRDGREVTRGGLKTVAEIRSLLQQGQ